MTETPAEIEARLLAARREGAASFEREPGSWSGGGYSPGTGAHSAWESGRKQAHNLGFVPDTTRSMTSNWRPAPSLSSVSSTPEHVNEYELLKGRVKRQEK